MLNIENLKAGYGKVEVLHGISIEVPKGKVVTLDPENLMVLTHWSPLSGSSDSPENYHTVRYELAGIEGGTNLTISQDNNPSEDEQRQNEQFWGTVLQGIKKLVE